MNARARALIHRWPDALLALALAAAIFAAGYATGLERPKFSDGSNWYLNLLGTGRLFWHDVFFRYSDALVQLPTWLWLRVRDGDPGLRGATTLLNAAYSFHPLLSLLATTLLLRRQRQLHVLPFAAASFGVATLSTHAYAQGIAPVTLSIFWPLLALHLAPADRYRTGGPRAALLGLLAALAFSYEPALLLFALLMPLAWRRRDRMALLLEAAATVFLVARLGWGDHGQAGASLSSLSQMAGNFQIASALVAAAIAATPLLDRYATPRLRERLPALVVVVVAASSVWYLGTLIDDARADALMSRAYLARLTAVPVGFALALGAVLAARRGVTPRLDRALRASAALAVLIGVAFDVAASRQWGEDAAGVARLLADRQGCDAITSRELGERWIPHHIPIWSLPMLTVLQNGSRQITRVVFVEDGGPDGRPDRHSCRLHDGGYLETDFGVHVQVGGSRLDYSRLGLR